MQDLAEAIGDRLAGFLYGFATGETAEAPGIIEAIFKQQSAAPTTVNADEIRLYALDDGANCGLFAKSEDGYTKQILKKIGTDLQLALENADVTADMIIDTKIRLRNNYALRGRNAANSADVNIIKVNASDVPEILVGAVLSASTAPASDPAIANKKYVDDQDATDHPAYTGGESHTDGSGLIIKAGIVSTNGWTAVPITFGSAFPNAVISFVVSGRKNDATEENWWPLSYSVSKTGATVVPAGVGIGTSPISGSKMDWFAVGY
jgi:hypothetical protein